MKRYSSGTGLLIYGCLWIGTGLISIIGMMIFENPVLGTIVRILAFPSTGFGIMFLVTLVRFIIDVIKNPKKPSSSKPIQSSPQNAIMVVSAADEIAKYKALLDSGTITQEEFEAKKKQLLGL